MSEPLSDEDDMEGTINLFANLAFPVYEGQYAKEKMAKVAKELQRWRAAFAWLCDACGAIYASNGFDGWSANVLEFRAGGATALEAIEALRAKVEVKP